MTTGRLAGLGLGIVTSRRQCSFRWLPPGCQASFGSVSVFGLSLENVLGETHYSEARLWLGLPARGRGRADGQWKPLIFNLGLGRSRAGLCPWGQQQEPGAGERSKLH